MKQLFSFAAMLLCLVGFAQNNHLDSKGLKQGKWQKTYDSGKIRYTGTFKNDIPVGKFTYYFEREGGIMSEIEYRGESGIGYAIAYHATGIKQAEGLYNKQLKDSVWTYYSRKGLLTQRESYHTGMLDGQRITYWENGKVAEIVDFVNDLEHGRWVRKWDNGSLRTKGGYTNGMLEGECVYYDESAKMIAKGSYHKSKKHGVWYYFEDNKVTSKETYRYGVLESETTYSDEQTEE